MENLNEIVAFQIVDEQGIFCGIETHEGKEIMLTENNYKVICSFEKVSFFVPQKSNKHLKLIKPSEFLVRTSKKDELKIMKCPPYWRCGVKVGTKMLTRIFELSSEEFFGKEVIGKVEIVERRSSKDPQKKPELILNLKPEKVLEHSDGKIKELKIGGKSKKKSIFAKVIPGTNELLRIV